MAIRVYFTDSVSADPVSEGDLSNPIFFQINPDLDPDEEKTLFLANERATLASDIDAAATNISLTETGRFADGDYLVIGQEIVKILSGGGTTSLTVARAQTGSTAAAHTAGDIVYSGYNYSDISVEYQDTEGTDESAWTRLVWAGGDLDLVEDGNAITAQNKAYNEVLEFRMRMTVPGSEPVHYKHDLVLRVTAVETQAIPY